MTRHLALVLSFVLCTVTASAVVPIEGDSVVCLGAWPVSLRAPTGLTSYRWNTGQTTNAIQIIGPGTYTVIVSRNGNPDTGTITVREAPLPDPDLSDEIVYICRGDFITHRAPPGFVRYVWSTGVQTSTIRIDTAGWYRLTVTDANGCMGSDSMQVVLIDRPKPTITGPYTVCNGAQVLYETENIPGAIYLWNVLGGILEGGQGKSLARIRWPGGSGSVELRVSVPRPDGGFCDTLVRLPVRVGPRLEPRISYTRLNFCVGDSTVLDAGGGFSIYQWNTGARTQTITVKAAGRYWANVIDASGCAGPTDTVTVGVYPLPDVRINGDTTLCPGQTTTLTAMAIANNVVQWQWSNGLAQKTIFVSEPGVYTVIGRTAQGCADTASITVISAADAALVAPDSIILDSLETNSGFFRPFIIENLTGQSIHVRSWRLASGRPNPSLSVPKFPNDIPGFGKLTFILAWLPDVEGPFEDTLLVEIDGPECPSTIRILLRGYRFIRPRVPVSISVGDAFVPVGTVLDMPIHVQATTTREELVTMEFSVTWNDYVFHVTELDPTIITSDVRTGSDRTVRYRLSSIKIPIDTSLSLRGTVLLGNPLETDLVPDSVVVTGTGRSVFETSTDPGHIASTACIIVRRVVRFTDAEPHTVITNLLGQVVDSNIDALPSGNYLITTYTGTSVHTYGISIVR